MDRYLTYEYLNSNNFENRSVIYEYSSIQHSKRITVFLSHRHNEPEKLINKVRGFFAWLGVDLYIDWLDKSMPEVTNSETAEKLKAKINTSDKFIILATPESIESIWIPWEIGLADQMKGTADIAILPLIHEDETWKKREYYQLYNRIECINDKWVVISPNRTFVGEDLKAWLRK